MYKKIRSSMSAVRKHLSVGVCVRIYTCLFSQVQITTVLLQWWFNQLPDWWIDCRNRLQITLTSPSLSTAAGWSGAWSPNANSHLGLLLPLTACVLGVLTVQKLRLPLQGDAAVWAAWLRNEAWGLIWARELRHHTDIVMSQRDKSPLFAPSLH